MNSNTHNHVSLLPHGAMIVRLTDERGVEKLHKVGKNRDYEIYLYL